jgi:hypothetical protein
LNEDYFSGFLNLLQNGFKKFLVSVNQNSKTNQERTKIDGKSNYFEKM